MSRSLIVTPTNLKLVRKDEHWEICFQAVGKINGQRVTAWLRQSDEAYFCSVGKEDQIENLPLPLVRNFFDDPFIYAIDETDATGKQKERIAGVDHSTIAQATYEATVGVYSPDKFIVLRHGGRILRKSRKRE
jgi:hypothetical protein